mgnify:CR=1 FL=1
MSDDKRSLTAGTIKISQAVLTNFKGESIDITPLISTLVIKESVYLIHSIYEFLIIDSVALLEKYVITGNEKIRLELVKSDSSNKQDEVQITKYLALAGIGAYNRPKPNIQGYTLTAITETAMVSTSMKVCKSVKGIIGNIISGLYKEIMYKSPLNSIDEETDGNFSIVLPNKTYKDTFVFLLKKAQRSNGNVFYMFETLFHNTIITSYEEIIGQSSVEEFRQVDGETEVKDTSANFDENRTRILDISSNLGASHYDGFKTGAFTAVVHDVDIAEKRYTRIPFNSHNSNLPKLNADYSISNDYTVGDKTLEDLNEAVSYFVNRNTMAFGNQLNISGKSDKTIAKRRAVFSNQYALSHKITVHGDTRVRAGVCIDIWIPQATDPTIVSEHKDELMSGKYMVASIDHMIDNLNNEYTMKVSIKKDSNNVSAFEGKYDYLEQK